MSNVNVTILVGNLTADPEVRGEGGNVAKFTIAVNGGFGEKRETTFVDCVAFNKRAEFVTKYFSKGKSIGVVGRLKQNNWEDKDGNRRSKLEVIVNEVSFVGPKGDSEDETEEATVAEGNEKLF